MDRPLRVAALASGRGSNLGALIAARLPVEFVLVGSDKPAAGALAIAREHGIPTVALKPRDFADRLAFDQALFGALADAKPDLLVLAGYMRIIDASVVADWEGRAINVHPSLLPKYQGLHTHRRCLEAGDNEHGASVHYVTAELDGGPVVAQARISVGPDDTEATLAQRLLVEEHKLLPAVVGAIANGRLRWNGAPLLDGTPLPSPVDITMLL
ncbi:phosphoribosylglycinamide formyltransferase [Bacillus sp. NP157]|nr:phosphoribosylglycinamide formyltransferase [Bacillus sp. NP157]